MLQYEYPALCSVLNFCISSHMVKSRFLFHFIVYFPSSSRWLAVKFGTSSSNRFSILISRTDVPNARITYLRAVLTVFLSSNRSSIREERLSFEHMSLPFFSHSCKETCILVEVSGFRGPFQRVPSDDGVVKLKCFALRHLFPPMPPGRI